MRGSQTVFTDLKTLQAPSAPRKGRSEERIAKRNECLFHRYIWYYINFHFRYEYIVTRLSDEFFLTEVTTADLLSDHPEEIKKIHKEPLSKNQLKELWPHLNWTEFKA